MMPTAGREPDASPILVVSFGRMGDIMRSISVVRMIHERHPDRPIDFIARRPGDEIARFVPEIRNVFVEHTPHKSVGLFEKIALARVLRQGGYGRAYTLSRSFKAGLIAYFAGIRERIGYFGEGRLFLLNQIRWRERRHRHLARRLCAVVLEPGEVLPDALPLPRLVVPDAEIAAWRARERIVDDGRPVLAIAPGASFEPRRWSIDHYIEIARRAHARGWHVWVLVDAIEAHLAKAIGAVVPVPEFQGNTVSDMIMKIAAADVFLGNESGPLHVASATQTPCVAVLGPTGPDDFAPINPIALVHPRPGVRAKKTKKNAVPSIVDVDLEEVDAAVLSALASARHARPVAAADRALERHDASRA